MDARSLYNRVPARCRVAGTGRALQCDIAIAIRSNMRRRMFANCRDPIGPELVRYQIIKSCLVLFFKKEHVLLFPFPSLPPRKFLSFSNPSVMSRAFLGRSARLNGLPLIGPHATSRANRRPALFWVAIIQKDGSPAWLQTVPRTTPPVQPADMRLRSILWLRSATQ